MNTDPKETQAGGEPIVNVDGNPIVNVDGQPILTPDAPPAEETK